ncbi:MAG: copper chaperone PCu(A)C [Arachnia sp.]
MKKNILCGVAAAALALTACSSSEDPGILAADPWIRTTAGTERPDMTALFVNFTNPGDADVTLIGADCGDVAGMYQLHEMVMVDGEMKMQEVDGGLVVPAGSHLHLAPGGPHIMLMDLKQDFEVGGEEITCTLEFDNDQTIEVTAPIKEFTEEQDTYHTHEASEG